MHVEIEGTRIFYEPLGPESSYPIIVLHGGPGLDHHEFRPWLDPLSDTLRLLLVDLRGHGQSDRVDPATLSLQRYAQDVTAMARQLDLDNYALLGHSYGAFITLAHAVELGDASHYIISSGSASMSKSAVEINNNLASFEPLELRQQVTESWAREPHVRTAEDAAELMRMQMPFHFASVDSEGYRRYASAPDETVYTPEILAYTAANEYAIEYEDQLGKVSKPTLIITGEYDRTCTPRAAREMHEGIAGSELLIIPDAGHMTFIEQPEIYFHAARDFLRDVAYAPLK